MRELQQKKRLHVICYEFCTLLTKQITVSQTPPQAPLSQRIPPLLKFVVI